MKDPVSAEVPGIVTAIEAADLNADGSPEIYIFTASDGRMALVAYSTNNKKSLTPIYLPELGSDPNHLRGYRGGDEFAVVENRLVRRFPLFPADSADPKPTGKMRQLQYRLHPGEAGWIFKLDRVVEF